MNFTSKISGLIALFCLVAIVSQAQVGYMNSQEIFAGMASTQAAKSQAETYAKQLSDAIIAKETRLQQKIQDGEKRAASGSMTQNDINALSAEIQKEALAIDKERREAQSKIIEKEESLMRPLLSDFQSAVDAIAKESGYKFILDSSVILYADPSTDISSKVKAKVN